MYPDQHLRLLKQAVAHHSAGRLDRADTIYRRIRLSSPTNFDAFHLSGIIALQKGHPEAVPLLRRALKLNPLSGPCAMRLGLALNAAGSLADAEAHLRLALRLDPKAAEPWDHLAHVLKIQDKLREAIECHKRAVELLPSRALSWYNFGLTLSLFGRIPDALRCHERALVADPSFVRGHYGRAQALHQSHRIAEAVEAYGRVVEMDPSNSEARSFRLFALNNLESLSRDELFAEHVAFGRALGVKPLPKFPNLPETGRRLRLAILSPDLRTHSCTYFLEPLLQNLNREDFEVYLYHDHFREDSASERLRSLGAVWRNFKGQTSAAVEATIRKDRPDILIDLSGHTGLVNRLPLFAHHLAPVQVAYLGYPNTTGVPAIGYRFTDSVADPYADADAYATEKLVRFAPTAWSYQPPEGSPAPNERPVIPGRTITFGCFNTLGKITDSVVSTWARVLESVPGSRLLLKGKGFSIEEVRSRYIDRFSACGICAERLALVEQTQGTREHLEQYHRVDIALDTFPYNGTTTTCEALWMGVPVVSLVGDRHASRVGASLLSAIGHNEWTAVSYEQYVEVAATLAGNTRNLSRIRRTLRSEMQASPLMDQVGQAVRFGAALRECWRDWCVGVVSDCTAA